MHNFEAVYRGVMFVGFVCESGPYGTRLSLTCECPDATQEDFDTVDWPGEAWISRKCGEKVSHWCSGEGSEDSIEEVYLPVSADKNAAENCRRMFS